MGLFIYLNDEYYFGIKCSDNVIKLNLEINFQIHENEVGSQ